MELHAKGQETGRSEALLREMVRSLNLLREIHSEIQRGIDLLEASAMRLIPTA